MDQHNGIQCTHFLDFEGPSDFSGFSDFGGTDPTTQDIDFGRGQMAKVQSSAQPFTFESAQRDSMYNFLDFEGPSDFSGFSDFGGTDPTTQDIDFGRGQTAKVQSRAQPFTFGSAQRDSMDKFLEWDRRTNYSRFLGSGATDGNRNVTDSTGTRRVQIPLPGPPAHSPRLVGEALPIVRIVPPTVLANKDNGSSMIETKLGQVRVLGTTTFTYNSDTKLFELSTDQRSQNQRPKREDVPPTAKRPPSQPTETINVTEGNENPTAEESGDQAENSAIPTQAFLAPPGPPVMMSTQTASHTTTAPRRGRKRKMCGCVMCLPIKRSRSSGSDEKQQQCVTRWLCREYHRDITRYGAIACILFIYLLCYTLNLNVKKRKKKITGRYYVLPEADNTSSKGGDKGVSKK